MSATASQSSSQTVTQTVPATKESVGTGLRPVVTLKNPPRNYGWWCSTIGPTQKKPKLLIMFSGRSREGDLAHQMARLGWLVCCLDTIAPKPTDLVPDTEWDQIKADLDAEYCRVDCNTLRHLLAVARKTTRSAGHQNCGAHHRHPGCHQGRGKPTPGLQHTMGPPS